MRKIENCPPEPSGIYSLSNETLIQIVEELGITDIYLRVREVSRLMNRIALSALQAKIPLQAPEPTSTGAPSTESTSTGAPPKLHEAYALSQAAAHVRLFANLTPGPLIFEGHAEPVFCVAFSDDGYTAMTLDGVGRNREYALTPHFDEKPEKLAGAPPSKSFDRLVGNLETACEMQVIAEKRQLLLATTAGVYLCELSGARSILRVLGRGAQDACFRAHASSDGNAIVASAPEGLRVWRSEAWHEPQRLPLPRSFVTLGDQPNPFLWCAIAPDKSFVVGLHVSNQCLLWRLNSPEPSASAVVHRDCTAFCLSPDGKLLATGYRNGAVCLRETKDVSGHPIDNGYWEATDSSAVRCMAFSPDGETLAISFGDSNISLWRFNMPESHDGWLRGPEDGSIIASLSWSKDGQLLLASGGNGYQVRLHAVPPSNSRVIETFTEICT